MNEGDHITFLFNNERISGTIIKKYTKIGFKDHGKEFIIIMPDNSGGLFNNNILKIELAKLKIIN
tara:strand:- start:283 stop:477 length:195 start_codon:yes stop_codon:yes gene_type:complete